MKILITTDLFTTRTNGVVTSTHNLIHDLKRRGHDVRVITFSKNGKSWCEDGVYYIKSMSLEWIYPEVRMPSSRAGKYVKEIVEWCPDVIHSQCEYFTYAFAKRVSKKTGAPIIHTYHTMYEDYVTYVFPFKRLGAWIVRKFIRSRLKHAYTVIAPTEKVKASLINFCKIKNRIAVIPSGICLDKHKIRITEDERREGRAAFGLTDENFVLFNLGRLGTEKNIDELISYFAKISAKHENARLLIVGGGPAREELEEHAFSVGALSNMTSPDSTGVTVSFCGKCQYGRDVIFQSVTEGKDFHLVEGADGKYVVQRVEQVDNNSSENPITTLLERLGCGASVSAPALLVAVAAIPFVLKKKKDD